MERAFMTPRDAAELLGISLRQVYGQVRSGKIPGVRFGRQLRIPKDSFAKMIEAKRATEAVGLTPRRRHWLKAKYGLGPLQYAELVHKQGGKCANGRCRADIRSAGVIDHDHLTDQIRGILCAGCNKSLGFARDMPTILRGLAEYAERNNMFLEREMPQKLREMSERQAELDAIAQEGRAN